jgi:hypothetical protein
MKRENSLTFILSRFAAASGSLPMLEFKVIIAATVLNWCTSENTKKIKIFKKNILFVN